MKNVFSIHAIIAWAGDSKEIETEEIYSNIHAHTHNMEEWAIEEHNNAGLEMFTSLLRASPPGVYSFIGQFKLLGGKDADTSNGPGECWTDVESDGNLHVYRLERDEFNQNDFITEGEGYTDEQLDILFTFPPENEISLSMLE